MRRGRRLRRLHRAGRLQRGLRLPLRLRRRGRLEVGPHLTGGRHLGRARDVADLRRLGRRGRLQSPDGVAEPHDVAVLQLSETGDPVVVHEGSVGRAEVFDREATGLAGADGGVAARDLRIRKHDVAAFTADRRAGLERMLAALHRLLLDEYEVRHGGSSLER